MTKPSDDELRQVDEALKQRQLEDASESEEVSVDAHPKLQKRVAEDEKRRKGGT